MNEYTTLAVAFQNESNPVKRDRIFMKLDAILRKINFRYIRAYRSSGFSIMELESVCRLEAYENLSRFDYSKGAEYNTYHSKCIHGAIQNYIRDNSDTIHIPANKKLRVAKAIRLWNKAKSENPDLEMSEEIEALINLNNMASLNVENSEGESLISTIKAPEWAGTDKDIILRDTRSLICKALMAVPKGERTAFWKTYHDNISLREIAEQMGVSHQSVDNWGKKAIAKMEKNLRGMKPELLEFA